MKLQWGCLAHIEGGRQSDGWLIGPGFVGVIVGASVGIGDVSNGEGHEGVVSGGVDGGGVVVDVFFWSLLKVDMIKIAAVKKISL